MKTTGYLESRRTSLQTAGKLLVRTAVTPKHQTVTREMLMVEATQLNCPAEEMKFLGEGGWLQRNINSE
jgi:hypothetical protein